MNRLRTTQGWHVDARPLTPTSAEKEKPNIGLIDDAQALRSAHKPASERPDRALVPRLANSSPMRPGELSPRPTSRRDAFGTLALGISNPYYSYVYHG